MKAKQIALILIPLNLILAYFVFNSINGEIEFETKARERIAENVQKIKDLRQVQIAYKKANHTYANNFESLIDFLENDSIAIINKKEIKGDTIIDGKQLTNAQALELGVIIRDTTYVLAKDSVFDYNYKKNRNKKYALPTLYTLPNVPHSDELYSINAGTVEKGKVKVQVFEISTTYAAVFTGLDAENKSYDLDNLLKVGSMDEASLNGNWRE